MLLNLFLEKKKVIVSGYTISGKSTLINTVLNTNLTISKNISTTLDFIKIPDSGGVKYLITVDSILKNINLNLSQYDALCFRIPSILKRIFSRCMRAMV